jgi:hypothetical protein
MRWVHVSALAVVLLATVQAAVGSTVITRSQAPVDELLGAYEAGQYDRAPGSIKTLSQGDFVVQSLLTNGPVWIQGGSDPAQVSRRRLVAASFALEVANGLSREDAFTVDSLRKFLEVRTRLIAWGGLALTTSRVVDQKLSAVPKADLPVMPAERLWFRSAAAMLEAGWVGLLDIRSLDLEAMSVRKWPTYPILSLAFIRFPDDPHLLLARAATEEQSGFVPSHVLYDANQLPQAAFLESVLAQIDPSASRVLEQALKHYRDLQGSEVVGAEANLRLGYVELVRGHRSAARDAFGQSNRLPADTFTRYLSRLLTGLAWQQDSRGSEAEAAYRSALEVLPRVHSGSALLAAALFFDGHRAEATTVLDAGFLERPGADDPWRTFLLRRAGDGRTWPAVLLELRAALR